MLQHKIYFGCSFDGFTSFAIAMTDCTFTVLPPIVRYLTLLIKLLYTSHFIIVA